MVSNTNEAKSQVNLQAAPRTIRNSCFQAQKEKDWIKKEVAPADLSHQHSVSTVSPSEKETSSPGHNLLLFALYLLFKLSKHSAKKVGINPILQMSE